jgi:hypothetical protein
VNGTVYYVHTCERFENLEHGVEMYEDKFVRSFILCEALHAFGAVAEDLMKDEEFTEAKMFQDYLTCKTGWLNGAAQEGFACKQVNLREARTRLTRTWPVHGLPVHMATLSGAWTH